MRSDSSVVIKAAWQNCGLDTSSPPYGTLQVYLYVRNGHVNLQPNYLDRSTLKDGIQVSGGGRVLRTPWNFGKNAQIVPILTLQRHETGSKTLPA
jgi:hypothetical protein